MESQTQEPQQQQQQQMEEAQEQTTQQLQEQQTTNPCSDKQQYQIKIDSMQKYVPFLKQLIEKLQAEPENAAKITQMQILLNILVNTETSVSIKELDKCEHALEGIYKIHEQSQAAEKPDTIITDNVQSNTAAEQEETKDAAVTEEINKTSTETQKPITKTSDEIVENIASKDETEKSIDEQRIKNRSEEQRDEAEVQSNEKSNDCAIDKTKDNNTNKEKTNTLDKKEIEENLKNKNVEKEEKNTKTSETQLELEASTELTDEKSKCTDTLEKNPQNTEEITVEEQASTDIQGQEKEEKAKGETEKNVEISSEAPTTKTAATDGLAIAEEESQQNGIANESEELEDSNETQHNNEHISTNYESDTDDHEMEENVELIKMPDEHDDEEMILPDSADENETGRAQTSDNEEEDDDEKQENTYTEEDDIEQNDNEIAEKKQLPHEKDTVEATIQNATESENESEVVEEHDNSSLQQVNEENEIDEEALRRINNVNVEAPEQEHELIALETANTDKDDETKNVDEDNQNNDDENTGGYDPLNYFTEEQTKESTTVMTKSATDSAADTVAVDDDEDEVQVIEVRNSPICLDSDDEDDNALEQSLLVPLRSEPTIVAPKRVTRSLPTERIFARKSTAKPANKAATATLAVPQIKKSTTNLSYLQNATQTLQRPQRVRKVVDTIDLLDSSDEDSNKRKSLVVPKRRQLLANNVTFSKYNNRLGRPPKAGVVTPTAAPPKRAALKPSVVAYIPTPQSNFLNTFNLQPASVGVNPPAFSATLSNKNVIIPNAFYGNPPEMRNNNSSSSSGTASRSNKNNADNIRVSEEDQLERSYRRWLENFLSHFSSPKQIASYSCFILLQRVLKYKLFVRIKDLRTKLNANAPNASYEVNMQLMLDLRQVFYTNDKKLSEIGRRFCELAYTHMIGKAVTLTTDARSGRVTSRTRSAEEVALEKQVNQITKKSNDNAEKPPANFSGIFKISTNLPSSSAATTTLSAAARKRQLDDGEYIPKNMGSSKNKETTVDEPKKSLRAKRTRRYDNNFSYNEDQDDFDEEDDDSYVAVQRRIERKRLEAKLQCEKQAKSFENAFIEMFAKNLKDKPLGINTNGMAESSSTTQKKIINGNSNSMEEHIIPDDNDVINLENSYEPIEHRIYKVIPTKLRAAATTTSVNVETPRRMATAKSRKRQAKEQYICDPEVITCDDNESNSHEVLDDDNDDIIAIDMDRIIIDPKDTPKNCNRSMHIASKNNEYCILCSRRFTHIVHHYVNDHRGCEVYTSRLSEQQAKRLRRLQGYQAVLSIYKNGQQQFEAECAFCAKRSRFMLPYWYQHYSMHTGEYAYRCNGCGIRKPTRPLLMSHINQSSSRACCQVRTDYTYETKVERIDAYLCTLCNYVQLNRKNIVHHLKMQHNQKQILPTYIETLPLLQLPANPSGASTSGASGSKSTRMSARKKRTTTVRDSEGAIYEIAEINAEEEQDVSTGSWPYDAGVDNDNSSMQPGSVDFSGGTWDAGDPGDDLSFMICGMLDVQMNPE